MLVFDTWHFGLLAGYSHTTFNVRDRSSSGTSDNYHVGLYGGTEWGSLAFRAGEVYTGHDISTSCLVAFSGLSNNLKGRYNASTTQTFGELAYGMRASASFANLAYVNLHPNGLRATRSFMLLASPPRPGHARLASSFARSTPIARTSSSHCW